MTGDAARSNEHGPCPDCGLSYLRDYGPDERYHRRVHDAAVNGHRTKLGDGFYAVTQETPISLQKLAQAAASAARHDTKYDLSAFTAFKKRVDKYDTIAMLCVKGGRICGLLVSRQRECECTTSLNSFQSDYLDSWRPTEVIEVKPHTRRAVDMIWVLKKHRRQGVAKGLIDALARHCKLKVEDIAHHTRPN
jgi:ribosomal protein S18 acetylase RimI-like enzyme